MRGQSKENLADAMLTFFAAAALALVTILVQVVLVDLVVLVLLSSVIKLVLFISYLFNLGFF